MKLKTQKIILISAIIVLAVALGGFIPFSDYYSESNSIVQSRSHNMFFDYTSLVYPTGVRIVSPSTDNISIGFDSSTDKINFGLAIAGGSTNRKFINVTNDADRIARISLNSRGNISSMISFSENEFILLPGEKREIAITLTATNNTIGNYGGDIEISLKKARFLMLNGFI
jgi:hypothetical protein